MKSTFAQPDQETSHHKDGNMKLKMASEAQEARWIEMGSCMREHEMYSDVDSCGSIPVAIAEYLANQCGRTLYLNMVGPRSLPAKTSG